jgi:hypothetical protein
VTRYLDRIKPFFVIFVPLRGFVMSRDRTVTVTSSGIAGLTSRRQDFGGPPYQPGITESTFRREACISAREN